MLLLFESLQQYFSPIVTENLRKRRSDDAYTTGNKSCNNGCTYNSVGLAEPPAARKAMTVVGMRSAGVLTVKVHFIAGGLRIRI